MTLKEDVQKLTSKWQKFFFDPISPVNIAIYRIIVGAITLECLLIHLLADWDLYFGDYAIIPIEDMISKYWFYKPFFDLMLFCETEHSRWIFFWFTVVCATMMLLGLFTRATTFLTFICLMSLQTHFCINQNSGDNFLRLSLFFLMFSNCGDALSIDRLIKAVRQDWRKTGFLAPLSAPWAQRLIQIQLAIAYGHTWICKIAGPQWNDGTAVYFASRYDDVMRFGIPFIMDNIWTIKILTWSTLLIELFLFTLIWYRPVRYWVLLAGVALHLGIEWTMNLPMFEWLFISSFILFIYPEDLRTFWDGVKAFIHKNIFKPATLYFDGNCLFCVRSLGLVHHLDIFGILKPVDFRKEKDLEAQGVDKNRLEEEMILKTQNGDTLGGFKAFRWMTGRMPLLMILYPVLYLPILAQIGDGVYKVIAANRNSILGGKCDHDACTFTHEPKEA